MFNESPCEAKMHMIYRLFVIAKKYCFSTALVLNHSQALLLPPALITNN